jgi:leucyl aminopeptidase
MGMEISAKTGDILGEPSDLAVLGCFEEVPLPDEVVALLEPADFKGRTDQLLLLYPRGSMAPRRLLLVGLGQRKKATAETIRRASAIAVKEA